MALTRSSCSYQPDRVATLNARSAGDTDIVLLLVTVSVAGPQLNVTRPPPDNAKVRWASSQVVTVLPLTPAHTMPVPHNSALNAMIAKPKINVKRNTFIVSSPGLFA